jgi:hypothetical protein
MLEEPPKALLVGKMGTRDEAGWRRKVQLGDFNEVGKLHEKLA